MILNNIVTLTQEKYDSLSLYNKNTLYIIGVKIKFKLRFKAFLDTGEWIPDIGSEEFRDQLIEKYK